MTQIYIIHAAADKTDKDNLVKFLTPYQQIEIWHDDLIAAGTLKNETIVSNISSCDIIIVLLSSDLLSDQTLLNTYREYLYHPKIIVPVLLRPCLWEREPSVNLLTLLPRDGRPVSQYTNRDEAYHHIAKEIIHVIESKRKQKVTSSSDSPNNIFSPAKKFVFSLKKVLLFLLPISVAIEIGIVIYQEPPPSFNLKKNVEEAEYLLDTGDYADAVKLYDEIIAHHPKHGEALNNRGWAKEQLGNLESAYDDYMKACALSKDQNNTKGPCANLNRIQLRK
jgi:hypothetical protein